MIRKFGKFNSCNSDFLVYLEGKLHTMLKSKLFQFVLALGFCSSVLAQKTITGILTSSKGNVFTIECEKIDELPSVTDTCSVSKDISGTKNPFGITIQTGWMGVADAFFLSRKEKSITFKVIRETTNIVINGKKQEQFIKGKKMKIDWK